MDFIRVLSEVTAALDRAGVHFARPARSPGVFKS